MRVLFTNHTLANRAGTELWVRDVALALRDRGHSPVAYSRTLGAVAAELRRATVPVVDDPRLVGEPPAIIHGHHHLETMTAMLHFPGVPAIAFCHGWAPHEESPPRFPRIHRYVAVDDLCRERLVSECGIPPERVVVIRNFVDLRRFASRRELPARPLRALAYSNHASEDGFIPALREACGAEGLTLDVAGLDSGRVVERPEQLLPTYDIVFAKGRSALEAAAVGAFVVLCDTAGLGPAVLPEELSRLRHLNFGVRLLTEAATPAAVRQRIARYSPVAAAEVCAALRDEAGLDKVVDQLLGLYGEVCAEAAATPPADVQSELRAAARYLRHGPLSGGDPWRHERETLLREAARAEGQGEAMAAELATLRSQLAGQQVEQVRQQAELTRQLAELTWQQAERTRRQAEQPHIDERLRAAEAELAARRVEVAWMRGTAAWRWRQRLVERPRLAALYRRLRRRRADPAG